MLRFGLEGYALPLELDLEYSRRRHSVPTEWRLSGPSVSVSRTSTTQMRASVLDRAASLSRPAGTFSLVRATCSTSATLRDFPIAMDAICDGNRGRRTASTGRSMTGFAETARSLCSRPTCQHGANLRGFCPAASGIAVAGVVRWLFTKGEHHHAREQRHSRLTTRLTPQPCKARRAPRSTLRTTRGMETTQVRAEARGSGRSRGPALMAAPAFAGR